MSISKVTELFSFDSHFIENIAIRPNGNLLLTSLTTNTIYGLDPSAENPQAEALAKLPGVASVTGIAQVGPDTYAISGGTMPQPFLFGKGTMHVYTLSFEDNTSKPEVKTVADVPDAEVMNGMCNLPDAKGIVLSADSREGRIWRVNTSTGAVDVAFQDDLLAMGTAENRVPCGVNGIKVHDGHLYFTNSAKRLFGRIPIASNGDRTGDTQHFTALPETIGMMDADDDFVVDASGAAWVARHPDMLVKITPDHKQEVLISKESHDVKLLSPTAIALDAKRKALYIVTGGDKIRGGSRGGQVVKVELV